MREKNACFCCNILFLFKQDTFTQQLKQDCHRTARALLESIDALSEPVLSVNKLYGLAHARVGLSVVAGHLAEIVRQDIPPQAIPMDIWNVIEAAQQLCGQPHCRLVK